MPAKAFTLLVIFFCCTRIAHAQQADTFHYYLDNDEKPTSPGKAVYHLKVYKEKPTDTYWKRDLYHKIEKVLASTGYSDSTGMINEGPYTAFMEKGKTYQTGSYKHGKEEGEWLTYNDNGTVFRKYHYTEGKLSGLNRSWFESGKLNDSFALDNAGTGPGVGYNEDGQLMYEGRFVNGKKNGRWKYYYDLPGQHESLEVVFIDDSSTTLKCFAENGAVQDHDCFYECDASYPGGDRAWASYIIDAIGDNNSFGKHVKDKITYTAVVRFVVGKDGNIIDPQVEDPKNKKLDKIAERIRRNSPRWIPAIQYNQKVNAYRRQPITFAVDYE